MKHIIRPGENKEKVETVYWKFIQKKLLLTDTFEDNSYEEEPIIIESEVKVTLKVLERNESPGGDRIPIGLLCQATENESVKITTIIFQQIWETNQWPTD